MTSNRVRKIAIGKGRVFVRHIGIAVLGLMVCLILLPNFALALEEDPSELFWVMIEEARWGESEAQYAVAMMYAAGEGVQEDQEEATKWFEKAAEEGHPHAMFKIAERYEKGIGVEKDPDKAMHWYREAAKTGVGKGNDEAYYSRMRDAKFAVMKDRYKRDQLEEDRKYEDQVRRENQRHQQRMQKEKYRYYNRHDYYYDRNRSYRRSR